MIREVDRSSPDEIDRFDLIGAISFWCSRNLQTESVTLTDFLKAQGWTDLLSDRVAGLIAMVGSKESAIELMQILLSEV